MKKSLRLLLVFTLVFHAGLFSSLSASPIQYNLGTSGFTIDSGGTTLPPGSYSQTETTLTLNGSFGFGSRISGLFVGAPYDWGTLVSEFPLRLSVSGVNPNVPFSVGLVDSAFVSNLFVGTTAGVLESATLVPLSSVSGGADLSDIVGLTFTFDESTPVNMTFYEVVPEPSTYALLAMAGVGALCFFRRRS